MNAHDLLNTIPAERSYGFAPNRSRHAVDFFCDAPEARGVFITGDFNHWQAHDIPMHRAAHGRWMAHLELLDGHRRYLFLVDGKPTLDRRANGKVRQRSPWYDAASMIAVS